MISIINEINSINSDRPKLREFGITIGAVLLVLAGLLFWRGKASYVYFLISGVLFLVFGLVIPMPLKPLQKIWIGFSIVVGFFMSRLILVIVFYAVTTPIGLLTKALGKDLLDERISKKQLSYWCERRAGAKPVESYENQY